MKQFKRKCTAFLLISSTILLIGCTQPIDIEEYDQSLSLSIEDTPPSLFFSLYYDSLCTQKIPRADGTLQSQGVISTGAYSYYLKSKLPQIYWGWLIDTQEDFTSFITIKNDSLYLYDTHSTFPIPDTLTSF